METTIASLVAGISSDAIVLLMERKKVERKRESEEQKRQEETMEAVQSALGAVTTQALQNLSNLPAASSKQGGASQQERSAAFKMVSEALDGVTQEVMWFLQARKKEQEKKTPTDKEKENEDTKVEERDAVKRQAEEQTNSTTDQSSNKNNNNHISKAEERRNKVAEIRARSKDMETAIAACRLKLQEGLSSLSSIRSQLMRMREG